MNEYRKMTYTNVQIFLKISMAALVEIIVEWEQLSIFLSYTINSLMTEKQILKLILSCPELYFR